ncbi:hypothetical protein DM860_002926 [Cuscuta australis]|uniref:Homeobox domain-containing protein n=1 Tax=Cuscuta australis TaxID=267555 RepID=A0A328D649_9ASTE|nr:hypothetical protein DM860_002926 [Cuscuta australis]
MTSSNNNKHWPSMFKAKGGGGGGGGGGKKALRVGDKNNPSSSSSRSGPSVGSTEERVPELKERWNPKPEQIRILEAVFNSGLVTPMREDIMKIRARIEEYGQVADSSVFYWFQNRKSRSKNRQRKQRRSADPPPLQQQQQNPPPPPLPLQPPLTAFAAPGMTLVSTTSTASSSSSSGNNNPGSYIQSPPAETEYLAELPPFVYPDATPLDGSGGASSSAAHFTQGFGFHAATAIDDDLPEASFTELLTVGNPSYGGFPATHLMGNFNQQFPSSSLSLPPPPPPFPGEGKVTVMINEMAFEVPAGPFNLREAFGDGAVLFHYATGQAVVTNEWGFTLHPLQHGESYCLLRTSP